VGLFGKESKCFHMELRVNVNLPAELQLMRKLKAYDTIQEHNQLTKVTRLPAEPFTLMGNIWGPKKNCSVNLRTSYDPFFYFIYMFRNYLGHYNPGDSPHAKRERSCVYLIITKTNCSNWFSKVF